MNFLFSVVTGCTEGIGEAFAKELGKRGCNVALVARNEAKMRQIAQEIGKVQSPSRSHLMWLLKYFICFVFLYLPSPTFVYLLYSTKLGVILFDSVQMQTSFL